MGDQLLDKISGDMHRLYEATALVSALDELTDQQVALLLLELANGYEIFSVQSEIIRHAAGRLGVSGKESDHVLEWVSSTLGNLYGDQSD